MPSLFSRLMALAEFALVYVLGKVLGLTWVVRYLRNPNPLTTVRLLRAFGARVGQRTTFKRGVIIDNAFEDQNAAGDLSNLVVGDNCYIGDDLYLDLANGISIADNVVISGQVAIVTHADCNRSPVLAGAYPRVCEPVRIEEGAWLGFRATVLAGVTVSRNSVVAAHSLLRSDTVNLGVYGGVPAVFIKRLDAKVELVSARVDSV